ncbi:hypothetical protein BaRGS_00033373 [Batillaria attramentaria]|uniref:Uncharacterized protein n=1 Tax=Batillaria attramentaria TaxID=370345 RepID=A0ABD0JK83_9CAEN
MGLTNVDSTDAQAGFLITVTQASCALPSQQVSLIPCNRLSRLMDGYTTRGALNAVTRALCKSQIHRAGLVCVLVVGYAFASPAINMYAATLYKTNRACR